MRTQFAAAAETVVDGNAAEMPSVVFGRGGISQIRFGLFQMRQEDRVVGINAFAPRLVVTVKMVFPQAFVQKLLSFVGDNFKVLVFGFGKLGQGHNVITHGFAIVDDSFRRDLDVQNLLFVGIGVG